MILFFLFCIYFKLHFRFEPLFNWIGAFTYCFNLFTYSFFYSHCDVLRFLLTQLTNMYRVINKGHNTQYMLWLSMLDGPWMFRWTDFLYNNYDTIHSKGNKSHVTSLQIKATGDSKLNDSPGCTCTGSCSFNFIHVLSLPLVGLEVFPSLKTADCETL